MRQQWRSIHFAYDVFTWYGTTGLETADLSNSGKNITSKHHVLPSKLTDTYTALFV